MWGEAASGRGVDDDDDLALKRREVEFGAIWSWDAVVIESFHSNSSTNN
jgi:hypothetical protein